jgi:hypothetical protein
MGGRFGAREGALSVFALVCLGAVAGPEYGGVGNRVTPFVLGLPFSLFWNALWVGLSFVALGAYHLSGPRGD